MNYNILFLVVLLGLSGVVNCATPYRPKATVIENNSPIIGILSQEISYALENKYPGEYTSFIAASYVKFVEGGGARAVPIWIDRQRDYYENIMSKINGVLLPGGATWFNQSNGYADAGRHIYDIAVEMNQNGDYFPVWGTCLGFELLTYLAANGAEHRAHCHSQKQPLPLDFKPDFRSSKMFANAPDKVIEILKNEPVTPNFHQYCVTEKNFTAFGLDEEWRIMSDNEDFEGLTFISSIEHKKYPFYGIQFHPEKNLYEWISNNNISHTSNAIQAAQYFAQFFIDETRKSDHTFMNHSDENNHMIYNFEVTFTGMKGSSYEQCYMFDEEVNYIGVKEFPDNSSNYLHFDKFLLALVLVVEAILFKING